MSAELSGEPARPTRAQIACSRVPRGWPAAAAASSTPRTCMSRHIGKRLLSTSVRLVRALIAGSRAQSGWPAAAAASSTPRTCTSSHIGTQLLAASVRVARAQIACSRVCSRVCCLLPCLLTCLLTDRLLPDPSGWPAAAAASSAARVCASCHIGAARTERAQLARASPRNSLRVLAWRHGRWRRCLPG